MDENEVVPQPEPEKPTEEQSVLAAMSEAIDAVTPEAKPEPDSEQQEETEPADVEEKAEEPAKPVEEKEVEKKPSDEFGDLPEAANAKTKERFGQLKTKFDEIATERDQYKKSAEINGEVVQLIQSTGATPEMFGGALEYLRLVNSPKPQDREQALALLDQQRKELALSLGKDLPGVDPLDGFADLKQKVESLAITREDAVELANARRRASTAENQASSIVRQQTEQQQLTAATQAVDQLGYRLAASDPGYNSKIRALAPTLAIIKRTVQPQHWAQEIEQAYRLLPDVAAPAPTPKPVSPAPIRTNSSGGATAKTPGSALDAINAALGL